jgi:SAM-dependent methyltransferase
MDIDAFIARWTAREGGAERANYQMFLSELCDLIGVARPDPAGAERGRNDYVFERAVRPRLSDDATAPRRIDLYKKGAFILEAKQSRLPGSKNALPGQQTLFEADPEHLGKRSGARGWDVMMQNARKQAEGYVFLLDADQPAPPFIIVCDVGHCLEVFADFTGTGRAYDQFPDRKGFRIFMDDLHRPDVRERLAAIWTDPHSLDPTKRSARVTREIAKRLAEVSKALEQKDCNPEDVAHFLMRCLFTMFAEDTDLLPHGSFRTLLEKSVEDPAHFPVRLKALWTDMESGAEFSHVIEARVRHFNGGLFKDTTVFELGREEIGELLAAARADWQEVDPAIFGTLLEQALSKTERKKLGAHYTPRAYVQRLVDVTVMEPLRADWQAALTKAEQAKEDGKGEEAIRLVRAFHHQLCTTRILDPACGTGNFLYVALELLKKLEGDVVQTLTDLGDAQASLALQGETIDPHQFLGLELNPRAAAIAELVIWIGYLQWHYRNYASHPNEPILRAFENINFGHREGYDAVLTWDGYPLPAVAVKDGKRVETYPNARQPKWPEAEFIVGNPPFIAGQNFRSEFGDSYSEAIWKLHAQLPGGADFVMFWWDRAADTLVESSSSLRRFGFVTTNSITQQFSGRVVSRHLKGKPPISLVFAIPNHPWTKATSGAAQVRIAMTVCEKGQLDGKLLEVSREGLLDTDEPQIDFVVKTGRINPNLTIGSDITSAQPLRANGGICHDGVKLHGKGFRISATEASYLGLGRRTGADAVIRLYVNGRDLNQHSRGSMVIDLFGLSADEVRARFPEIYQHLLERVKPERDKNRRPIRRENWWLFGENQPKMRSSILNQVRFIATVDTARHRIFQFLGEKTVCDDKIVIVADSDAFLLSALTSRAHVLWSLRAGVRMGVGNDPVYASNRCFDPFPFPDPGEHLKSRLRALGEELDATRKRVQAEHPDLTLTGLYNVLEKLKAGAPLTEADEDVKQRGLVLILKELHEQIDALTFQAYGWPAELSDEQILERLVALNAERAKEEAAGLVRWLRPDYQIPRFAKGAAAKSGELDLGEAVVAIDKALPAFPTDRYEQPLAVEAMLAAAGRPMSAAELARGFKRGGKRIEQRVVQVLTTLARYGRVSVLSDGAYSARRAA